MPPEHTHEEESIESPILAPKVLQEEMAKRFGYIAGSLTFVLLIFPELLSGLPHPDSVGLALLGTGLMYVLGYFMGHIWYAPCPKRKKPRNKKPKHAKQTTPVEDPMPKLPPLTKEAPASTSPEAEVDPKSQAIESPASVEDR